MLIQHLRNKRGFTLIEIIVVIALIGILALVIVPKYTANLARGRDATIKSNLESLRSAVSLFTADNSGTLPAADLSDLVPTYIRAIPDETVTPSNAVAATASGAGGWYYDTTNNEVYVNLGATATDADGLLYADY